MQREGKCSDGDGGGDDGVTVMKGGDGGGDNGMSGLRSGKWWGCDGILR